MDAVLAEKAIKGLGDKPTLKNFIEQFAVFVQGPGGFDRLKSLILSIAFTGKFTSYRKTVNYGFGRLPNDWTWESLESVIHFTNGFAFKSLDYIDEGIGIVRIGDINPRGEIFPDKMKYVREDYIDELSEDLQVRPGDLVIAMSGATTGKLGFNKTAYTFLLNQRVGKIQFLKLDEHYGFYYLSTKIKENLDKSRGAAIPNLSTKQIKEILVPLPPLEEQKRIVAKVDELMALCDQLQTQQQQQANTLIKANTAAIHALLSAESSGTTKHKAGRQNPQNKKKKSFKDAWERIANNFHTLYGNTLPMPPGEGRQKKYFVGLENLKELRKVISTLAVEGKLTLHSNNHVDIDSIKKSCSDLREQYIHDKWMRKQKIVSMDTTKVSVANYPVHWVVEVFDNVAVVIGGITKGRNLKNRGIVSYPYLRVANVQRGYFDLDVIKEIVIPVDEYDKYKLKNGDILLTEGGDWDKVGRTSIWRNQIPRCLHQNHVFKARVPSGKIDTQWVELVFNSGVGQEYFSKCSKQTTNLASINMTQLRSFPFPIPPIDEQNNIVSKVNGLMALCDQLEQQLRTSYDEAEKFINVTIKSLVA